MDDAAGNAARDAMVSRSGRTRDRAGQIQADIAGRDGRRNGEWASLTDASMPVEAAGAVSPDTGLVDLHNHIIPGVDDGAMDDDESASALAAFKADGVIALIATPHVDLSLQNRDGMAARLAELDHGWSRLERVSAGCGVVVHRGAELKLDTADPDVSDPRLRLGGTRFVLVEFPFFMVPPRSARVLALLVSRGWLPVVAHPERYSGLDRDLAEAVAWRDAGALLQVNGGSLLGRYGDGPRRLALRLLSRGLVDYLSSDYHARGRPRIRDYRAELTGRGAGEQAELLTSVNPRRLLRDERPLPVAPITRGSVDDESV